ncbi:transmembrane protein 131-like isoform X1 [Branchiostoma floridae x Branchiostoma belcheri]
MAGPGKDSAISHSDFQRCFPLLVSFIHFVLTCLQLAGAQEQAFVQTDYRELRHMVDGAPLQGSDAQTFGARPPEDSFWDHRKIRLKPPLLDFEEQPVGIPKLEKVVVINPSRKESLRLEAVSGTTLHFHSSFFQQKLLPPGGNTSFDVVFLARMVGNVENTLFIQTNKGTFPYQVFGVGVPNPYRLRPFLGARVPLNSSFSPVINMHNPHSEPLQVVEMYSSGGDLHLELPSGQTEAPQKLWEIPPYETKPVMRASFVGREEKNHTAFIRIKTLPNHESLILPVEVEVTSAPGIYSSTEMLDFGTLLSVDEPKTLQLHLLNPMARDVQITNIKLSSPNDAVSIDYKPVTLKPSVGGRDTKVASVTFYANKATTHRQWAGKIVVKSKDKNIPKLEIPYQAEVLHGTLGYEQNCTLFYIGPATTEPIVREVMLTNTFDFPVVVHNATLPEEAQQYFSIVDFPEPVTILPQKKHVPFLLKFLPDGVNSVLSTFLLLYTNISRFSLPVQSYSGLLKASVHSADNSLDFGTMGSKDKRSMTFAVTNSNPTEVTINSINTTLPMHETRFEILGVEEGNGTYLTMEHRDRPQVPFTLKPHHYSVWLVEVVAPKEEGVFQGSFNIVTDHETLQIPMSARVALGSITAKEIKFSPTFPGKVAHKSIFVQSSFSYKTKVESLVPVLPADDRFYFKKKDSIKTEVEPNKKTKIGTLFFDPRLECLDDCYVGLPTSTADGHQWLSSLTLDKEAGDIDSQLYQNFLTKWTDLKTSGQTSPNVTLHISTSLVKGPLTTASAQLQFPTLVTDQNLDFPLTHVGGKSTRRLTIQNPADVPILVQLVPLALYPNASSVLEYIHHSIDPHNKIFELTADSDIFYILDTENKNVSTSRSIATQRSTVESKLGVRPNRTVVTASIAPGAEFSVHVGFTPKSSEAQVLTAIFIRNNLTILDAVIASGQGAREEFRLGNRKPGKGTKLKFDLKEEHLADCNRTLKARVPNFTVRKTFMAKNAGQLPIQVTQMEINGQLCQGYGFRVLNCEPFTINPNGTHRVDIAFTPDFTLAQVQRELWITTARDQVLKYTLLAKVPHNKLGPCAAAMPRPPWEHMLYVSCAFLMTVLFIGVLMAAYLESERITEPLNRRNLGNDLQQQHQNILPPEKLNPFDLRKDVDRGKPLHHDVTDGAHDQTGSAVRRKKDPSPPSGGGSVTPTLLNNRVVSSQAVNNGKTNITVVSEKKFLPDKIKHNNLGNQVSFVDNIHDDPSSKRSRPSKQRNLEDWETLDEMEKCKPEGSFDDVELPPKGSKDGKGRRSSEPLTSLQEDLSLETTQESPNSSSPQRRGGKVKPKRKLKTALRREEKERRARERKEAMKEQIPDDASSTTTENSNPDLESIDKDSKDTSSVLSDLSDQLEPFGPPDNGKEKPKTKSKKEPLAMDPEDFKPFEKARSKSRRSDKENLYGNVMRPSSSDMSGLILNFTEEGIAAEGQRRTLELPYTTALEASERQAKGLTSPHSIAASVAKRALKKNRKGRDEKSDTSSEGGKDSPPPLWDLPKSGSASEDSLHQLSLQTRQAGHLFRDEILSSGSLSPSSPTPLTGNAPQVASRLTGSSYSSVVSGANKRKTVSKTMSAPMDPLASAFTPASTSQKNPGVIGSKTMPPKSLSMTSLKRNPWKASGQDSSNTSSESSSPGASWAGAGSQRLTSGFSSEGNVPSAFFSDVSAFPPTPTGTEYKGTPASLKDSAVGFERSIKRPREADPFSSSWEGVFNPAANVNNLLEEDPQPTFDPQATFHPFGTVAGTSALWDTPSFSSAMGEQPPWSRETGSPQRPSPLLSTSAPTSMWDIPASSADALWSMPSTTSTAGLFPSIWPPSPDTLQGGAAAHPDGNGQEKPEAQSAVSRLGSLFSNSIWGPSLAGVNSDPWAPAPKKDDN